MWAAGIVGIDLKLPEGFQFDMTADSLGCACSARASRGKYENVRDGCLAERDFPKLTGSAASRHRPVFIEIRQGFRFCRVRAKAPQHA